MRRSFILLVTAVVCAALVAAGCGGGSSSPPSVPADGVAVVGGQTITKAAYLSLLAQAKRTYAAQKRTFPKLGSSAFKSLQDQAVAYLVQQSEFEQRAKDLGIDVTDKQVDARLAQIKQQYFGGSASKYQAQLKQQGLTEADVKNQIRIQLLSERIFNKVTASTKITDKDARNYYNAHKSQYQIPASRTVRHILVNSKSLADRIYSQLRGGASFAALAKKYSKDPGSAARGGSLGTIQQGQTVPQFDKAAFALPTRGLSKPVHSQYGWHIIQPTSPVKAAQTTPFSKEKAAIKQQLAQTKKNNAMTAWINDTKKAFCDGKLAYQEGYKPLSDPCASLTKTGTATTTSQ
ncbi:MAG TPA: peptidylprolyl isomerase [Gaiellaceae bacterium]